MFRGRHEYTMTKTGRVSIPSRFREFCRKKYQSEKLVVTNYDQYLLAYPEKEWDKIAKKFSQVSMTDTSATDAVRYFVGSSVDCPVDGQGRVLIPQTLREYAQLEDEVVIVGMMTRMEIWSKRVFNENNGVGAYETFKKNKDILAERGI